MYTTFITSNFSTDIICNVGKMKKIVSSNRYSSMEIFKSLDIIGFIELNVFIQFHENLHKNKEN